jgi:hypothetical protein
MSTQNVSVQYRITIRILTTFSFIARPARTSRFSVLLTTDYLEDFKETKDVVFVRPKKQVISLRLEPQVINKLKELADKEGLPPTTYARMLIIRAIRDKAA